MQRDAMHSILVTSDRGSEASWRSLLDAMGTLEFDQALTRFLPVLSGTCAAHDATVLPLDTQSFESASPENAQRLAATMDALIAIVRKHIEAVIASPANVNEDKAISGPLCSLEIIERCLADWTKLPRRELEVCARILFGMSSVAIAIDLYLREPTVKTYRKRAYQRLEIQSKRELLNWYLQAWGTWRVPSERVKCSAINGA